MFLKPKYVSFFVLFVICATATSCKKEIYKLDGCEFTQNGVNKYNFSCTREIDPTATYSDDDFISMAHEKAEKSGAQLALSHNLNWVYISKISAKLDNSSKIPENKIKINGKILIGDVKLNQKFHDAKNVQTILDGVK